MTSFKKCAKCGKDFADESMFQQERYCDMCSPGGCWKLVAERRGYEKRDVPDVTE